jgi:predicted Rossmann-fold nucleotide-binding protein
VLVRSSDGLIAIGGRYGTLSEIAIALKTEKPVVSLGSWELGPPVIAAEDPHDAVEKIFKALERG